MELYATELMGSKAYDAQGNYVGRVREFFIEPADQPNRISHFLLTRGHFPPLVARHARELVCADLATVALPEPGGEMLVLEVADGVERHVEGDEHRRADDLPPHRAVTGPIIDHVIGPITGGDHL